MPSVLKDQHDPRPTHSEHNCAAGHERRDSHSLTGWWRINRALRDLGAVSAETRSAAVERLMSMGQSAAPHLLKALNGSPRAACVASFALARMGIRVGVQSVLRRCYDEEWLTDATRAFEVSEGLQILEQGSIGVALEAGLDGASAERELQGCFDRLTLALSALRVLNAQALACPIAWWIRSFRFGDACLPRLRDHPFAGLAHVTTSQIRAEAVIGLARQDRAACFDEMCEGLTSADRSVQRSAIAGFQKLRDRRALQHLQPIAFGAAHPLALDCRKAIEHIAGLNAEQLVLVRSSYADANVTQFDDLVRPVASEPDYDQQDLLRSRDPFQRD